MRKAGAEAVKVPGVMRIIKRDVMDVDDVECQFPAKYRILAQQ